MKKNNENHQKNAKSVTKTNKIIEIKKKHRFVKKCLKSVRNVGNHAKSHANQ